MPQTSALPADDIDMCTIAGILPWNIARSNECVVKCIEGLRYAWKCDSVDDRFVIEGVDCTSGVIDGSVADRVIEMYGARKGHVVSGRLRDDDDAPLRNKLCESFVKCVKDGHYGFVTFDETLLDDDADGGDGDSTINNAMAPVLEEEYSEYANGRKGGVIIGVNDIGVRMGTGRYFDDFYCDDIEVYEKEREEEEREKLRRALKMKESRGGVGTGSGNVSNFDRVRNDAIGFRPRVNEDGRRSPTVSDIKTSHVGVVERVVRGGDGNDIGMVVDIDEFDVKGLVHKSEISRTCFVEKVTDYYNVGDVVNVRIKNYEELNGKRRMSLTCKELEWHDASNLIKGINKPASLKMDRPGIDKLPAVGSFIRGKIRRVFDNGDVVVDVGFRRFGYMRREDIDERLPRRKIKVGLEVDVKIVAVDKGRGSGNGNGNGKDGGKDQGKDQGKILLAMHESAVEERKAIVKNMIAKIDRSKVARRAENDDTPLHVHIEKNIRNKNVVPLPLVDEGFLPCWNARPELEQVKLIPGRKIGLKEKERILRCMTCAGFTKTAREHFDINYCGRRFPRILNREHVDIVEFYSKMYDVFGATRSIGYLMKDSLVCTLMNKHRMSSRAKVYKDKTLRLLVNQFPVSNEKRQIRFRTESRNPYEWKCVRLPKYVVPTLPGHIEDFERDKRKDEERKLKRGARRKARNEAKKLANPEPVIRTW
jgi:predicted RNA-binding protein with RPS1 domain